MTALIDADSMIHIIAHNFKDIDPDPGSIQELRNHVSKFIESILLMTKATHYLGAIGTEDRLCFRHEMYKFARYKGNRPPSEEWIVKWRPHIRHWMASHWGFVSCDGYEADDIIATLGRYAYKIGAPFVICSPDKDLNAVPGKKFNYKAAENQFSEVNDIDANYTFWIQVITGDSGDNVFGVPGLGPVKAKKLLVGADPIEYKSIAIQAYCKYFNEYYGPIIFEENYTCIKMGIFENNDDYISTMNALLQSIKPVEEPKNSTVFANL